MDTKLKPCPFCGGIAKLIKNALRLYGRGDCMVKCRGCGCGTEILLPEEDAVKIWNTRVERTCRRLTGFELWPEISSYCSKCGEHLPLDAVYCSKCGSKIGV